MTVVYCLQIYARLTICAENLLLLHPFITRLSSETAAFFSSRLLRRRRVCFWMHSFLSSLSFHVVNHSIMSPIADFLSLTSASSTIALTFSCLVRLPVTVVSFLVVSLFRCRHLICSLQLVIAIIRLPLVNFSFS